MAGEKKGVRAMSYLPYGELTKLDEDLLIQIAIKASKISSIAVDIGTFFGRSAIILSKYISTVYTIDVFEDIDLIEMETSKLHYNEHIKKYPRTYQEIKDNLSEYQNIHVIKGNSSDKADIINDDSISLLFFDAEHTFEGLKKDFISWYPKLKKEGYLIVHDSGPYSHWMEPILFVLTIQEGMEKIGESDISTAWRKF